MTLLTFVMCAICVWSWRTAKYGHMLWVQWPAMWGHVLWVQWPAMWGHVFLMALSCHRLLHAVVLSSG